MASLDFNVGKDCQVIIVMAGYGPLTLDHVIEFQAEQLSHEVTLPRLNDVPLFRYLPNGWRGRFTIDRGSSNAEDVISAIEAGYWAGARLPTGQVFQYISEVLGSTSTYMFDNCTIRLSEGGQWRAQSATRQTLEFSASTKRRV